MTVQQQMLLDCSNRITDCSIRAPDVLMEFAAALIASL